ncbi:MAG: hypothetical protein ACI9UK_001893 [Candidatus Krumholzibacteriia bacterium]|jgi:hypothetical protein
MAHQFCDHLDEYGVQYTRTEASYRQCVNLLERIMDENAPGGLTSLITSAVREWTEEGEKLRTMLVTAVAVGEVRVPTAIVKNAAQKSPRSRQSSKENEHPICAACGFAVPRLDYPEWKLAANGNVSFKDQELVFSDSLLV